MVFEVTLLPMIQRRGQGPDAFYVASEELANVDAIGIQGVGEPFDERPEEFGPNGGRNLAGYLQKAPALVTGGPSLCCPLRLMMITHVDRAFACKPYPAHRAFQSALLLASIGRRSLPFTKKQQRHLNPYLPLRVRNVPWMDQVVIRVCLPNHSLCADLHKFPAPRPKGTSHRLPCPLATLGQEPALLHVVVHEI